MKDLTFTCQGCGRDFKATPESIVETHGLPEKTPPGSTAMVITEEFLKGMTEEQLAVHGLSIADRDIMLAQEGEDSAHFFCPRCQEKIH